MTAVRDERASSIPDDLRRFILTSVPSVPYLEAMLLLRRESGSPWTAEKVARNLYLSDAKAGEIVRDLLAAGVIARKEPSARDFVYRPPPELDQLLERVARVYSTHLVEVTRLIHSSLDRRAQNFADAFRLRKDS